MDTGGDRKRGITEREVLKEGALFNHRPAADFFTWFNGSESEQLERETGEKSQVRRSQTEMESECG